jgi:serpin B
MKKYKKIFTVLSLIALAVLTYILNAPRCSSMDKCNNEFAIELYKQIKDKDDSNIAISPFGIFNAMAIPYVGSKGDTAEQIKKIMHFDINQKHFQQTFAKIKNETLKGNNYTTSEEGENNKTEEISALNVAGSMWIDKEYPLFLSFKSNLERNLDATVSSANLGHRQPSATKINTWISDITNEKINNIVTAKDIAAGSPMMLVNALYFKGRWAEEFKVSCNKYERFYTTYGEGKTKVFPVNMMKLKKSLPYIENDELQMLRIPHDNSNIDMAILLPKKEDGLAELEDKITPKMVKKLINRAQPYAVTVSMPAFNIDKTYQLTPILTDMGLTKPFEEEANFSGISTKKGLHIGNVIQRTVLKIDEKGAKKEIAPEEDTEKTNGNGKKEKEYPTIFTANHPFMYILFDKETNQILFIGRVTNPTVFKIKS